MCRPNKIITRTNISFLISYVIIRKSNLKSNYHTTNILHKTMHKMQTYTRKIWVKMLAVKGAVNDLKCCFVFGCLIVRLQQKVAFSPTTFGLCSQSPACFCQPTNEFIFILIEHLSYEFKSGLYPTIHGALGRHYAQCNWIMVAPVKMHQTCMNTRVSISLIHSCSLLKCKHN